MSPDASQTHSSPSPRTAGKSERQLEPRVITEFDRPDRRYDPGETVRVSYRIRGIGDVAVRVIERSALWYTEGKGEEDLGVCFFERLADPQRMPPAVRDGEFSFRLPASPLTYEGTIVKIRWCVRVRMFFVGRRDFISEHVFDVGDLPLVRSGAPLSDATP